MWHETWQFAVVWTKSCQSQRDSAHFVAIRILESESMFVWNIGMILNGLVHLVSSLDFDMQLWSYWHDHLPSTEGLASVMTDFFRPTGAGHLLLAWKESILHPAALWWKAMLTMRKEELQVGSLKFQCQWLVSGVEATFADPTGFMMLHIYQPSRFVVYSMLDLLLLITYFIFCG